MAHIKFEPAHHELETNLRKLVDLRGEDGANRFVWSSAPANYMYSFGIDASNFGVKQDLRALFPNFEPTFTQNSKPIDDSAEVYPTVGHVWIIKFTKIPGTTVTVKFI